MCVGCPLFSFARSSVVGSGLELEEGSQTGGRIASAHVTGLTCENTLGGSRAHGWHLHPGCLPVQTLVPAVDP
ncbi:hypothetical protein NDU88_002428 [Pleurodeles waltl]|uniref:Secreted protein n=1 Tax=Pleurodeles waltl TaxID=8319 RepID=A0AAV7MXC8_PLEWA|nr:hypothetical protein NDU88_002428 [Pleurodeles waltl]